MITSVHMNIYLSCICITVLINFTGGQTSHRTSLMYVQAEDIKVHGNFPINIPKKWIKEEVARILLNVTNMYQGKCSCTTWKKYVLDSDVLLQKKQMFFNSLCRNTIDAKNIMFVISCSLYYCNIMVVICYCTGHQWRV